MLQVEVDKRVFPIEGGVGSGYVANAIANSNGIVSFDKGTMVECSIATLAKEGNTVTPVCFEFSAARNYNLDPEWVGKEARETGSDSALKPKPVETKTTKLILTQFALQDLFAYTLINAIKADSVQRNQSPFKGKLGEQSRIRKPHHLRRRLIPRRTAHRQSSTAKAYPTKKPP